MALTTLSRLAFVLVAVLAGGCSADRPLARLPEATELGAARESAVIDGILVRFSAKVRRNYMPGTSERGVGVLANLDSRPWPLPAGIAIDQVYVTHADRVWTAAVRERPDQPIGVLRASALGGPRWEPDQVVDVFVRIHVPEGPAVYVAARDEPIGRVQ